MKIFSKFGGRVTEKWIYLSGFVSRSLEGHYGPECLPCPKQEGRICSGHGKCVGSGTRDGSGTYHCDTGYGYNNCSDCSKGFYRMTQNDKIFVSSATQNAMVAMVQARVAVWLAKVVLKWQRAGVKISTNVTLNQFVAKRKSVPIQRVRINVTACLVTREKHCNV